MEGDIVGAGWAVDAQLLERFPRGRSTESAQVLD